MLIESCFWDLVGVVCVLPEFGSAFLFHFLGKTKENGSLFLLFLLFLRFVSSVTNKI